MREYVGNIEDATLENDYFRKVIHTSKYGQLVVMTLLPNQEIGMEVHPKTDQFFRIESGEGRVIIDREEYRISDGYAVVVPAGSEHNVINTSSRPLRLYTIYMPPQHRDGTIHKTKEDAMQDESDHL